ncbi:MAG: hypothetical protein OXC47_05115 [Cyanobacteria bacterium MAG APA_bin_95]|nr:hypothetical protein [Cyanobacteria bacterium MAG APA_bin_95]
MDGSAGAKVTDYCCSIDLIRQLHHLGDAQPFAVDTDPTGLAMLLPPEGRSPPTPARTDSSAYGL